jgi:glycosyltransferase involved in cell wall biosynthesis
VRLVRIITRLNVGGPAIQAVGLAARLRARDYETLLLHGRLSPGEGDMSYLLDVESVDATFCPLLGREVTPLRDFRALWGIYRELCRFQPRIVHTHTAKAGALGRLAALLYNRTRGRRAPARLVHTYHGHVFEGYFTPRSTSIFLAIERWLARRTNVIVAIAPVIARDIVGKYRVGSAAQVRLIHLGFDLSRFSSIADAARPAARVRLRLPRHGPVITTVGRLTDIKDHDLFIEMARRLSSVLPGAVFIIAGDGERRSTLERAAAAAGIENRVRFLGWRRDLEDLYAATDLFVLTSRNEGTPVALIEAMAAGVPGVSTDVGGVRDVITSPDIGVLVPPGDARSLVQAVQALWDGGEAARRQMGQRARQAVVARFSLDRLVADIDALYRQLATD